ncbi:hypothetical protein [Flavihumibacter profundi]|jgi:hypothetical protein|uniref:hypothetical protein n=1 Tax=Flavihumibacter profundi TaxID=2716883 RepID=UPI001CC41C5E|nr:hypothetical protein [Flavihumibacter profundi]MBZ5857286.1 hypothetical protein [Flavihumibacter profundi]
MKNNALLITTILLVIWGCSKESSMVNNSDTGVQVTDTTAVNRDSIKTISYKSEGWEAYPYSGGPGEDSLYWCWSPSFDQFQDFLPENIVSVFVNSGGNLEKAFNGTISLQRDSGYYYIPGNTSSRPKAISLWWIQKVPGNTPFADSVFVNYNPLR